MLVQIFWGIVSPEGSFSSVVNVKVLFNVCDRETVEVER